MIKSNIRTILLVSIAALGVGTTSAQESFIKTLTLQDLNDFRPQAGNWQIVGDVTMNPTVDIHHEEKKEVPEGKKKKKKAKDTPATPQPQAVTFKPGQGILLNMNDETKKDNLVSTFEHGDIELELEVMIPKGSNSGIYLQGRYEIQLLDSWGVLDAKYSDIGGIYRNWEKEPGKIYMGKAPLSNPAKAPGLWQKMKISFRAPKFDSTGKKIANARFVSVELNGVKIHDNVEVPLPTGGPLENNEKPMGPLMIQGDHGPVAFRNINYRLMKEIKFSLSDISYKTYQGKFKFIDDFTSLKPAATGKSAELSCEILEDEDAYGSIYSGTLNVPEEGTYQFTMQYTGGARLVINNQRLINSEDPTGEGSDKALLALKAGSYPVEIYNYKDASWMPPRLGLFVQSETTYPQSLHAFNSLPPDEEPTSPIFIKVGSEAKLLRAFLDFKGQRKDRLTHTIGVGHPSGTHYVYDLSAANLVCVWHGDFVDATPMWHDRGDGSFRPLGAVQFLFNSQPIAFLASANEAFPSAGQNKGVRSHGYRIDESTSMPVFNFTYEGLDVEDKVYPDDNNRMITHEVLIKDRGSKPGLYYKLAEGSAIQFLTGDLYVVDDKEYYIKVNPSLQPVIRDANGNKELIVPMSSALKYSIIW